MYNVIDQNTGNVIYRAWSFTERHRQAQLYAAQVRARRAMGERYAHHPRHSLRTVTINVRRIENA